jgi:hypothetical protein
MSKRFKYFLKQKAIGLVMLIASFIPLLANEGVIIHMFITVPIGLILLFSKSMIIEDDYYFEVQERKARMRVGKR